jgi:hypothetical protein
MSGALNCHRKISQEDLENAEGFEGVVSQSGNRFVTFDQELVTQVTRAEAIPAGNVMRETEML